MHSDTVSGQNPSINADYHAKLKAAAEAQHAKMANQCGILGGCEVARERTVYEVLTNEIEQAVGRANAILVKRKNLTNSLGRREMDLPESVFRNKYSLDIWGPF